MGNRDEELARIATPPHRIVGGKYEIFAATDNSAGGTWLGVNSAGLVATVTNRYSKANMTNSGISRGLLCLESLANYGSAHDATHYVEKKLLTRQYRPASFVLADREEIFEITYEAEVAVARIASNYAIFTNCAFAGRQLPATLDMTKEPEIYGEDWVTASSIIRGNTAQTLLAAMPQADIAGTIAHLQKIASYHNPAEAMHPYHSLCRHPIKKMQHYGTSSCTILAVNRDISKTIYLYCQGNPCSQPFTDYSVIVQKNSNYRFS